MYVFIIILIVFGILLLKNKPTSPTSEQPETIESISEENKNVIDYKTYYKPKTYITTKTEGIFYNVLLDITKELNFTLFAQVPLYAIVNTQDNLDYSTKKIF